MKSIWTAWANYGATGEGQTWALWIGYATDSGDARASFRKHFGDFLYTFCETALGVVTNEVTDRLLPTSTIESLQRADTKIDVEYFAQLHVNGS